MSTAYFPHSAIAAEPFFDFPSQVDRFDAGFEHTLRDELIMENISVVGIVLHRLLAKLPPSVEADDLHSAGVLGLIDAAEKFDPSREVRFRTYAELRVRGAMLDYLRSLSWAPRGLHRRERELEEARTFIEQKNHRSATTDEIAEEMGLSVEECHLLLAEINRLRMRDDAEISNERVHLSCHSPFQVAEGDDPFRRFERKEMLDLIWRAALSLPERLHLALRLYYLEERTLKEVGAILEVNEARASQLLSKAVSIISQETVRLLSPQQEEKFLSHRRAKASRRPARPRRSVKSLSAPCVARA